MPDTRATVCDRCERLISRDSKVCPYCGVQRAGWRAAEALREWMSERSVARLLIAANVAMFVVALALSGARALEVRERGFFDFLGPRWEVSLFLGAFDPRAVKQDGEVWRLLTAVFLHAGVLHLAFNMSWLRSVGPLLEQEFGSFRFAIVYLGSGLAGSLACLATDAGALGASGAIFGLLGAGWAHGRRRGGVWGAAVRKQFLAWTIGGVVFTLLLGSVVSVPGHFGGLGGGLALGWLLSPTTRGRAGTSREGRWITLAGGGLLACVPVAFALAIGFGLLRPSAASIPFRIGGRERLERWPLERFDLAAIGAPGWSIDVPAHWEERTRGEADRRVFDGALGSNVALVVVTSSLVRQPLATIARSASAGLDADRELDVTWVDPADQELDGELRDEGGRVEILLHLHRVGEERLLLVRSHARAGAPEEWRALHVRVARSIRAGD